MENWQKYWIHLNMLLYYEKDFIVNYLTHWARVTHIYASRIIIDWDNDLSPGRYQAIIWTNVGMLLIGPPRIKPSELSSRSDLKVCMRIKFAWKQFMAIGFYSPPTIYSFMMIQWDTWRLHTKMPNGHTIYTPWNMHTALLLLTLRFLVVTSELFIHIFKDALFALEQ